MNEENTIDATIDENGKVKEMTFGDKFKEKVSKGKDFVVENKTACIAIATIVIPAAVDIFKTIAKKENLKEERRLKDNYVYDRQHGHYYETRRKIKPSEWRRIDELKDTGESLGDILDGMHLLK